MNQDYGYLSPTRRKRIFNFIIVAILIISGLSLVFDFGSENLTVEGAKTIIVDKGGGGNHTTIQAAIKAANPGDTIRVWAGTYTENIVVNKTVILIGNGTSNTTIDGSWIGDSLTITADSVEVSNFKLISSGENGIYLYNVSKCKIFNNTCIPSNGIGILLQGSSNNIIINNNCSDKPYYGIKLEGSWNNTLLNNNCSNCTYGINLFMSSNNKIDNSICSLNYFDGIWVDESSNNKLINNTCSNNDDGIRLTDSPKNTLINNTCASNYKSGITIRNSSNTTLINNTCLNNNWGIYLVSSSNNMLKLYTPFLKVLVLRLKRLNPAFASLILYIPLCCPSVLVIIISTSLSYGKINSMTRFSSAGFG